MNRVLQGLPRCNVYIDDIVLCSDTWEEHIQDLGDLFNRLSKAGLTVNLAKSEIGEGSVTYLGHVVGHGAVHPREAKVEAIVNFPVPLDRKSLLRFLGMAGFYRKFCKNFSEIVLSLTALTSKKAKFIWDDHCQKAFDSVKSMLSSHPVLLAPDFHKPFKLAVDASDLGCGSVLLQEDNLGIAHPVAYFSKKFNQHQCNYSPIEKEALALLLALQHFDVYISTSCEPTLVYSDHNPLTFVQKMKCKNQRLLRWSLILQEYNLDVKHIKGKDNVLADTLSRM